MQHPLVYINRLLDVTEIVASWYVFRITGSNHDIAIYMGVDGEGRLIPAACITAADMSS